MVTKKDVIKVLKTVNDPEIMIDVWALGLIYEIKIEKSTVFIEMTFTTPMCPYGPMLIDMIESELKNELKVKKVEIEIVFDPPWQPNEDLKAAFGV